MNPKQEPGLTCSTKESVHIPPMRLFCCNLNVLIYVVVVMVAVVVVVMEVVLSDNLFMNSTNPVGLQQLY